MKLKKSPINIANKNNNVCELAYKMFLTTGKINYYLFYRELENLTLKNEQTKDNGIAR